MDQDWLPTPVIVFFCTQVQMGRFPENQESGASGFHHANADSDLAVWEQGSILERWYPTLYGNTGTNEAVPSALALMPQNSVSPCISLAPPESLCFH